MQRCSRCGGQLNSTDSRQVKGTQVYHLYCHWKIEQKEKERENQLREKCSGDTDLLNGKRP